MRFFADRTAALLQVFHVIVDGLYDSVPIILSFMVIAFGARERDAGVVLSVAALLGTLAGLGTEGCSQHILTPLLFGFIASAFSAECIYVLMAVVSVSAVAPVLWPARA